MNTQAHRCFLVIVFSLIGIFIVFLSFVFVTSAQSRTWYIKADGTGDAPTIQAGIDSASTGDTVLVASGTYSDSNQVIVDDQSVSNTVYIYKNVILLAESGPDVTTINGSQCDIAVYVSGADSTAEISGFTINTAFSGYGCVDLTSSSKQSVYAGEVQPYGEIAVMCQNSTPTILGNRLFDNGTSILLEQASPTIVGNDVSRSAYGIFINDTSSPVIEGNILYDCAALIFVQNSSPAICNNQLFSKSDDVCVGIALDSSSGLISGNSIRSTYNYGIYMVASSTIVTGNRFENNSNAVFDVGGLDCTRGIGQKTT
jgi:parallel beta-helix repeat protein